MAGSNMPANSSNSGGVKKAGSQGKQKKSEQNNKAAPEGNASEVLLAAEETQNVDGAKPEAKPEAAAEPSPDGFVLLGTPPAASADAKAMAAPVKAPSKAPVVVEGPWMHSFHTGVAHLGLLLWSTTAVFVFLVFAICLCIIWLPYAAYAFFTTEPVLPGVRKAPIKPQTSWAMASLMSSSAILESGIVKLYEAPLRIQLPAILVSLVTNYTLLCLYVHDGQPLPACLEWIVPGTVRVVFANLMPS